MRSRPTLQGLTLIELLIVVAVVAILSAVAVPNFLEAQTRAKVSAAKNNIRVVVNALEVYALDNNAYPAMRPRFPDDRLGVMANVQCQVLTEPIAYVSGGVFNDPFSRIREISYFRDRYGVPAPSASNPHKSLLYYNYRNLALNWAMPCLERRGAAVVSIGPDLADSLGAYGPFNTQCFGQMYPGSGGEEDYHPINTLYDPTNGTISAGDISGYAGEGRLRYLR